MSELRKLSQKQTYEMETEVVSAGSLTTFRLPELGLGARLYLTVKGQLNVAKNAGTAVLSKLGIRNLISRITVRLNDGNLVYEMEGFNTRIPTMLQNGFDPDQILINRAFSATTPHKAPTAGEALNTAVYDVIFTVEVPFINNDKDMLGLILLQNGTTQATVEIQWNKVTSANGLHSLVQTTGDATATFAGNVVPQLEFFSLPNVPDPKTLKEILAPHLSWQHQWKSEYQSVESSATLKKKLERGGIYTKIMHQLIVNGDRNSLAFENFRILMGGNNNPLTVKRDLQLYLQRRNYGFDLPDGLIVHDMDRSFGIEEFGDFRDYIDSRKITELISEVSYDKGTAFGADSYIYTITQKLVPVNF